jgi:hypothetical protein
MADRYEVESIISAHPEMLLADAMQLRAWAAQMRINEAVFNANARMIAELVEVTKVTHRAKPLLSRVMDALS